MEADAQEHHGWMHRITNDYDFLIHRAAYHLAGGRYEHARRDYIRASAVEPSRPQPYVGLGVVAMRLDDRQGAQTAFETATRIDPACSKAFCGLAAVHHGQARPAQAAGMYRRCLEIDGDNLTALFGLLELSAEDKQFDTARHFLQQYTSRHPDDVAVRLCLAAVHLNEEEFGAARETLLEVMILDPQNATASALLEELDHIRVNRDLQRARQMYLMPSW